MQNTWAPLKEQDKVFIIAPGAGSPISKEISTNWEDLEKCCETLRDWNLEPIYSKNIFGHHKSYYNFANTDEARYQDFVNAFQSDAKAVWSFRGGYGSDRVVAAAIKNNLKPSSPKLFIGFSDVTNIHSYLNSHLKLSSLHALSLRQLGMKLVDEVDIHTTREIIFGNKSTISLSLTPLNDIAKQDKIIKSVINGGNLSIIQSSLGTPWQTSTQNNILLLEDVGEAPYRIARMLQQFIAGSFLKTTQAILLGDFLPQENMHLVIEEFLQQVSIPVLQYEAIGHGKKNHPIPLGSNTELQLGLKAQLKINIR